MSRSLIDLDMLLDYINEKIVMITLIGSASVIMITLIYRFLGTAYLTVGSTIWLIVLVGLGYMLSIARVAFSDYLLPHKVVMNEVEMLLMKWVSPFVMLLSILIIAFRLITLNPNIHFYLFLFSFFGFFIYSYEEKDSMKEDYNRISSEISHRRNTDDKIL